MCGINGLIGFSNAKDIIVSMNETIKHRGPDAEGVWNSNFLFLGHRRLSIIDLSKEANQPFVKDNLVIVYNGEIYNFLELKEELKKKGVIFRTNSDTEVVLELFKVYREECFAKLIGMFAFCIYDMARKEVFLVRDYFGIKPLYYSKMDNNRFIFSSELKSLLKVPGIRKEINRKAMVSSFNYLWIYGDESIFRNISKVPPAHYMYIKVNSAGHDIKVKRYWCLKKSRLDISESRAKERLKELLEKSIRRHLVSDVEVGSFLSGGLDSSLISAVAKSFNADLRSYTISLTHKDSSIERMPDDNIFAKKVADKLNISHKDIPVKASAVENLNDIIYALDEPIGDPAAINTYLICKAARENGIKVLLSGMGADELFAGYRRHYAVLLAEKMNFLPDFSKAGIKGLLKHIPVRIGSRGIRQIRWLKRFFSFVDMPIDAAYMRSYSYYSKDNLRRLFNNDVDNEIKCMYNDHHDIFYRVEGLDNINRMCYTDINMFMQGLNLAYTDKASMAASVEVRVPFIDREIVEFAMSVSGAYKLRRGVSKYILKKAALEYLPTEIVHRPKASFSMPIRSWISGDLKDMVDDLLSESQVRKRGLLNYAYVKEIIEKDRKGIEDNAYRIYQMLSFELWYERFIDG
jgi:asparagine synthase (glutamine-hydrolysing)